jgi:hypothetical protein
MDSASLDGGSHSDGSHRRHHCVECEVGWVPYRRGVNGAGSRGNPPARAMPLGSNASRSSPGPTKLRCRTHQRESCIASRTNPCSRLRTFRMPLWQPATADIQIRTIKTRRAVNDPLGSPKTHSSVSENNMRISSRSSTNAARPSRCGRLRSTTSATCATRRHAGERAASPVYATAYHASATDNPL